MLIPVALIRICLPLLIKDRARDRKDRARRRIRADCRAPRREWPHPAGGMLSRAVRSDCGLTVLETTGLVYGTSFFGSRFIKTSATVTAASLLLT